MKNVVKESAQLRPLKVLLVGNNPIELSTVLATLKQVRNRKLITEIAFDIRSIVERLATFQPNFILIDDNIGRAELRQTVSKLAESKKTRDIPITVLKNSNYRESFAATSILDYLLKQNLSSEALYNTIRNALRFKRTQALLAKAFKRRKGFAESLVSLNPLNLVG